MKTKWFNRTKTAAKSSAIALVTAALVFAAGSHIVGHRATRLGNVLLTTASSDFSISSTISSASATQTPARLEPGVERYFWYTVSNPLAAPITVTSMYIPSGGVTAPAGCPASNLDLSDTTFSGSLTVPGKVGTTNGTASVEAGAISLKETGTDQDGCQNVTFSFTYIGDGIYSEVYSTQTDVVSSQNPSVVGNAVTYTATVTGIVGSGQDPLPNGPTGTVSFTDNGNPVSGCTNVPVVVAATTSTAQCVSPVYPLPASHPITAAYTNSDGNFTGSQDSLTQVVNLPAGCSGTYNTIIGNPSSPTIKGTNKNDYIYAFGANYTINAGQGSDCIVAGDGNNTITAGNNNNVIVAGNGTNTITAGNGDNQITVGNGSNNKITGGNGDNTVVLGTGANNTVTLGNGANTITITTPGNHDAITVGNGHNTAYLGGGTYNSFKGGKKNNNTCHLPSLPASTYHDTLTNCTAVTP